MHWQRNMTQFLKVEGHADLVRDTNSHAIINKNRTAYLIAKKELQKQQNIKMKCVQLLER